MPVCSMCKMDDDNHIDYGEFMTKSDISVHYYCLLLSTNLRQTGLDCSGILGFLVRDIRIEIKNAEERICCYCKKPHASIGCFICNRYFHNICGNDKGCVSEFINGFHSYCHRHVPFANEKRLPQQNLSECWICSEPLGEYNPAKTLRAYCCNNGYVHRHCLRKYALTSGYYLVCIWCGNKVFRDDVRMHGVFVPDRQATWDNNETLRYTDLHRGYSQCDAKTCICPQGREYFRGVMWKLLVCCTCGANGIHAKCGLDNMSKNSFTCESCIKIVSESKKSKEKRKHSKNALNYTMFMSKTFQETKNLKTTVESSSHCEENSDSEASTSHTLCKQQTPKHPLISPRPKLPQMREMFMFGKNKEITGTVQVKQEELQRKPDNTLVCTDEDILECSSSNKLLKSIFSDIVAEGRELSMDMVDEVFERFKLSVETFGDDQIESSSND